MVCFTHLLHQIHTLSTVLGKEVPHVCLHDGQELIRVLNGVRVRDSAIPTNHMNSVLPQLLQACASVACQYKDQQNWCLWTVCIVLPDDIHVVIPSYAHRTTPAVIARNEEVLVFTTFACFDHTPWLVAVKQVWQGGLNGLGVSWNDGHRDSGDVLHLLDICCKLLIRIYKLVRNIPPLVWWHACSRQYHDAVLLSKCSHARATMSVPAWPSQTWPQTLALSLPKSTTLWKEVLIDALKDRLHVCTKQKLPAHLILPAFHEIVGQPINCQLALFAFFLPAIQSSKNVYRAPAWWALCLIQVVGGLLQFGVELHKLLSCMLLPASHMFRSLVDLQQS
mmetsp:Transcript_15037/g.34254  ORF Transcript_15037/g.34254 Transcript_15037/m.34254 type:complete len:336 (-) Transcript_15037:439-1446(-)